MYDTPHPPSDKLKSILARMAASAGKPVEQAETLPPEAYTSQEIYDLEVEKIFRRDWLPVAHISQIPNAGDYVPIDLCGELLMVVHGRDDVIRTMSRVCLHRWAPLVNGPGNTRTFMCPFHAWGYALDGKLIGTPLMEKAEGFDPKKCTLPTYRTEVVDGFVYMTFNPDAAPLGPQLADMLDHLGNVRIADLKVGEVIDYDLPFNWKIVVETFMECYHHLAAHPVTFERDFPARLSWCEPARPAWTVCHSPARPGIAPAIFDHGLPFMKGLSDAQMQAFSMYLVFPYMVFSRNPDRLGWYRLQPVGPHHTRAQYLIFYPPETLEREDLKPALAKRSAGLAPIFQEDIDVNTMQQAGAASASATVGRLSHLEGTVADLANYVRARLLE